MTLFESPIFWIIVVIGCCIALGDKIINDVRKYRRHHSKRHSKK